MAKSIKAIKCPHCGSVQKNQVKEDQYRCSNCNTEYFIDSDDVNVNVRHSYQTPQTPFPKAKLGNAQKVAIGILSVFGFMFLILITLLISNKPNKRSPGTTSGGYRYSCTIHGHTGVVLNGKPYIVCEGTRSKSGSNNEPVLYLYNVNTGKQENVFVLPEHTGRNITNMRRFSDGNVYITIDKKHIYRLNCNTKQFEDYNPVIQAHEEFKTGFASIDIKYLRYAESIDIMSNMGDELIYYPLIDSVYTKEEVQEVLRKEILRPDARDSVYYTFTGSWPSSAKNPIQLLEVTFMYNMGGIDEIVFDPRTEKDRKTDSLKIKFSSYSSKILSYRAINPERTYFHPKIVYYGNNDLLISVHANASEDSPLSIQKIDTQTGEVIWSQPAEGDPYYYFYRSIKAEDKYVVNYGRKRYLVFSEEGKLLKEIEL